MLCCCVAMLLGGYVFARQATGRQKMFRQRKLKFRGGRECEPRDACAGKFRGEKAARVSEARALVQREA